MKSLLTVLLVLLVVISLHAQRPDRSKPPELGPLPSLYVPPLQRLKLSNDIPVVLMEKHNVPLVQIDLLVNAGSAWDPPGKSGLASITADMLDEGAGMRSALELADAIDFLGARISTFSGMHVSVVSLQTPLSKLEQALPLMADIAMRPTFSAEELERKRKERLTTLAQWHDEPRVIASVLLNRVVYGTEHPYGQPMLGTERSIRSFTVDDLRKFHGEQFHAGNVSFIVVGDVFPASLHAQLEALFGSWQKKSTRVPSWPAVQQVRERRIYLVDKPGAAQSVIRIGRVGAERMTGDYFALRVLNTILGGSFASRLNQNLRETNQFAYGASSSFDFRVLPGPFIASSDVFTDVTGKALAEFLHELNNILTPVSDEELTRAKNYLALGFIDNFQTVAQIANQLGELVAYNLPDDYFNTYTQRVLEVTKEDVERGAKKYLDPGNIAIVVVGDRKKIERDIRARNLGPVQNLRIQDVLGKVPRVPN